MDPHQSIKQFTPSTRLSFSLLSLQPQQWRKGRPDAGISFDAANAANICVSFTCRSGTTRYRQYFLYCSMNYKVIQSAGSWASGSIRSVLSVSSVNTSLVNCLSAADTSHVGQIMTAKISPTAVNDWLPWNECGFITDSRYRGFLFLSLWLKQQVLAEAHEGRVRNDNLCNLNQSEGIIPYVCTTKTQPLVWRKVKNLNGIITSLNS